MKGITSTVRQAAKEVLASNPNLKFMSLFSDLVHGAKVTAGYSEVRSVKLGWMKCTPTEVIKITNLINAAGYRVIKHYHNPGNSYDGHVWGQRFWVGLPNPEPIAERPLRVAYMNGTV